MVLLAAAVTTKPGKAIMCRQFVEMTKARIEGLLAAFPKLMGSGGKQHTFVETESVRYVYQPLDKLYMLLITTKASNILEDLETLRLFSRVVPEYCKNLDEAEIIDNAFNLIFAFDEIVALGYRESVNLAQIRTFVEMDSHEEKVYQAVRQTQEREAKNKMREKAKELQRQRQEAAKRGIKAPSGFGSSGGFGSNTSPPFTSPTTPVNEVFGSDIGKPQYGVTSSKPLGPSKAMKLGSKGKDVDSFVDQLKSEGEHVVSTAQQAKAIPKLSVPTAQQEPVHIRTEERITLSARRDGGLDQMEVHGLVTLRISDEQFGRVQLVVLNEDSKGIQLQTHPNIDKELFKTSQLVALKNPAKPFPLNTDVGVLKWRFQTTDESVIPLSINCWPTENGQGGFDVNIEYSLEDEVLELNDVQITIPLPPSSAPVIGDCDGEYHHDPRRNTLEWRHPIIDRSNKSATLEFSAKAASADEFFPVVVNFISKKSYCDLKVMEIQFVDDKMPVKFSQDTGVLVDKYEII